MGGSTVAAENPLLVPGPLSKSNPAPFSEPSDKYVEENKQTSWYRDTH